MDDRSVAAFQRNQASQIARAMIDQSEAHERQMQAHGHEQWINAHQELVTLLRFLDPEYDESREKANFPLEKDSDSDLAYLILARIRTLQHQVARNDSLGELAALRLELQAANQRCESLSQTNGELAETNRRLEREMAALQVHLSALRQAQVSALQQTTTTQTRTPKDGRSDDLAIHPPAWVESWRESKTFERSSLAIRVMGATGMALRPSILRAMAQRLALSADNSSLDDALLRLLEADESGRPALVELIAGTPKQGASSGGNYPDVLRLTAAGIIAYQCLTGQAARENDYDRLCPLHSSPEHTILNLQATEILTEAGYVIQGQAQAISLPNGGEFVPDLTAVEPASGALIFIEVERDVHKDPAVRKQKWLNLHAVSHGNLYIFCDNLSCQRKVQAEINQALGGLPFNSYLTNLHGLRAGKRSSVDGGIWLSVRKTNPT